MPATELVTVRLMVHPAAGIAMLLKFRAVAPAVRAGAVQPVQVCVGVWLALTDILVRVSVKDPLV